MSRVALLIGVSRYPTGLDPLPDAQKDVEVLKRVLKQPQAHFESVQSLCDRPLQEMQEAIELFFRQRTSDDQVVFLFSGYSLQDAEGKLYFATPSTKLPETKLPDAKLGDIKLTAQGAIVKAQTIPASELQALMNASPAKQQVCILDCYSPIVPDRPSVAKPAPWSAQLEGAGRVILAASQGDRLPSPVALDAWTYTRYLAEGIEAGAADINDDGILTAAALHHYAARKLKIAAPALDPQLYGSTETAQMPLLEVPTHHPRLHYRKVLEAAARESNTASDAALDGRSLLNDVRHSLGLSPQDATELEAQVLRPVQEYEQRLALYQEQVQTQARSLTAGSSESRQALTQLQRALLLRDQDVAMMAIAPTLIGHQHQQVQYQEALLQYQHVLLSAMQRHTPLQESDRALLYRLQQTLQLKDDDVKPLESAILTQAAQFTAQTAGVSPQQTQVAETAKARFASQPSTDHMPEPKGSESNVPESNVPEPTVLEPKPTEPKPTEPKPPNPHPFSHPTDAESSSAASRAKEVVLQQLLNPPELGRVPSPNQPPPAEALPVPVREEALPVSPNVTPTPMDRTRRSAPHYQALIIPLLLLTALVVAVATMLSSPNRPGWFSWLKWGQATADPKAAQLLTDNGLRQTQAGYNKAAIDDYNRAIAKNPTDPTAYMNRGVAHHRLGDTGAAIQDYEQALKLNPNSALLYSNLSYAYYDRQDYDKAIDAGNKAVALDGRSAEAHINLANARSKKGEYDAALRDYAQAIALNPAAPILAGAYNNRGNVQLALKKTSEAVSDYSRAMQLNPDYADAYYNLGVVQESLGKNTAAKRYLQTAARLYQQQGKESLQKETTDHANTLQQGN